MKQTVELTSSTEPDGLSTTLPSTCWFNLAVDYKYSYIYANGKPNARSIHSTTCRSPHL